MTQIKIYKMGFTGTQVGLTTIQRQMIRQFLVERIHTITELHHGDCVGADTQVHQIFDELRQEYQLLSKIIIHPPLNDKKRAFCKADKFIEPHDYLYRNKTIVNSTDFLVATPKSLTPELRSGTWSTIRYAIFKQKQVFIIFPNGEIK